MRRRDFLTGGMAFPVTTALSRLTPALASPLPQKIIDVHSHIFNSQDLPMVEFIEKSFIRNAVSEEKIAPYGPLIDAILRDIATQLRDSTGDENKYLDSIDIDGHKARSPNEIENSERQFVIRLFRGWRERSVPLPARTKLTVEVIAAYFPIITFGYLRRELTPGSFSGPKDFSFGSAVDNSDDAFKLPVDSDYLAKRIYDREGPNGIISYTIKWVPIFTRYRRELAEELSRVNHGRAVLVTPAMVDFTKWLDASSAQMTTLAQQVALMARLSREDRKDQPHIHGFVAFDPLRQAIYDKVGGTPEQAPFSIVEKAIMEDGFIGIKLYPPMGFSPTRNAAAGNDFPCWVRFGSGSPGYGERCVRPKNTPDGLGDTPGQQLDDVLAKLYAWCADKNVPIMAHTADSNAAGPGYGTRANPDYWNLVLQQPQFRTLRINMAHFGSFKAAFTTGTLKPQALSQTWEWKIGRMSAANPTAMIFADLSYFSEILDPKSTLRRQTLTAMRQFLKEFPNSDKLLLYGTDWSMIGHEPNFFTMTMRLPDLVAEFLAEAGYSSQDQLENIFFRNAARFLGLLPRDRANGTRGRLEAFYNAPANYAWLQIFDQIT